MTARPRLWARKIDLLMRPIYVNAKFAARQRSCGRRPSAYGAIQISSHLRQVPASISRQCSVPGSHSFFLTTDYSITDYSPHCCLYSQTRSSRVKAVARKTALSDNRAQRAGVTILRVHPRNTCQTQSNPVKPLFFPARGLGWRLPAFPPPPA